MIDYTNNKMLFKRLLSNLDSKLFPRMQKRDKYLNDLLEGEKPAALVAEKELNNEMREYITLITNYVIVLEEANDQLLKLSKKDDSDYVKILEQELLHDFRKRNSIIT